MVHSRFANALNRCQRVENLLFANFKWAEGSHDRWCHHIDTQTIGLAAEIVELVGVGHIVGHRSREELDWIMRLHIGGLVRHDCIGCGMRLVEAIVSELGQQVENHIRLRLVDTAFNRTIDETNALLVHLLADLLTHRATQKVSFTERIARKHLRDLHNLFLIDDNALRFLDKAVDFRVNGGDFLLTVLTCIIGRYVLHRPRTIKRHKRNDVLNPVRTHAEQRLAHARTFNLKHADGFAARKHFISQCIIERQARKVNFNAFSRNKLDGCFQHGERFQTKKVELDQSRLLDPLHVKLSNRHIRTRIAIHWHEFGKRPIANHDTCGVR
ncbi:hypothetical protein D3C80_918340 [compost metagenome]